MLSRGLACLFLANAMVPSAAPAQTQERAPKAWVGDLGLAATNALFGGVTAGIAAAIRGEDVNDAFLGGTAGGAIVFLGKRLAVEKFDGAGLFGRQVAGVGSSVVSNAGAGRRWLAEIWLPAGPLWLQVRPKAGYQARLNLADLGVTVWAVARPELKFDLTRSLSNGAVVFMSERHQIKLGPEQINGFTIGGVIGIGDDDLDGGETQSHENIHVIQNDYLLQTFARPVEQWGWSRLGAHGIPFEASINMVALPRLLRKLREAEAELLEGR